MNQRKGSFGFTIIELLVTISIIGIISAGGLATYIDFNRNQIIVQSSSRIVEFLRLAQSMAANNVKPSICSGDLLKSFVFQFTSQTDFKITAECQTIIGTEEFDIDKVGSLPSGVSVTGLTKVKFKVLRQGIEFTGGKTLTVSGFSKTKVVTVGDGGEINIQ